MDVNKIMGERIARDSASRLAARALDAPAAASVASREDTTVRTLSPRRAFARLRANIEARRAFDRAQDELDNLVLTEDSPCGCESGSCGPTYRHPDLGQHDDITNERLDDPEPDYRDTHRGVRDDW